ncbi:lysylphosphatidylglycerol synthase domain-containing protein, partial [Streptomyces sp. MCAF7]
LRIGPLLPDRIGPVLPLAVGAAICALVAAVLAIRPVRRIVRTFLVTALTDARSLHARPSRALALWGGSVAFPVLQAAGLAAVAVAVELDVPPGHVVLAYLAATCLAAVIPSPGGIGSVDAALVIALVATGAP